MRNVCVCIWVKRQEWILWQQVMVFTLDTCIFKNGRQRKRQKQTITYKPAFRSVCSSFFLMVEWDTSLQYVNLESLEETEVTFPCEKEGRRRFLNKTVKLPLRGNTDHGPDLIQTCWSFKTRPGGPGVTLSLTLPRGGGVNSAWSGEMGDVVNSFCLGGRGGQQYLVWDGWGHVNSSWSW